ncbi:ATP-binding protein [Frisingicoccus sp.]|uniref:ATP-binding protein n=1 Tax=Frisingicoccus sp. TaxID=1918627 RepID=UPI0038654F1A
MPTSLWDTYSSFANCYGGVIILGVAENQDGSWRTTGLKHVEKGKLLKEFWDTVNNRKKVNINLLSDEDVEVFDVGEDIVIVIYVPMARREQKPVYINDDIFGGTFRRNHEGDYHCTRLQVKSMLRDQTDNTMDMEVLDDAPLEDLNYETIQGYRNRHRTLKAGHPFERLNDAEYLRSIGAAAISKEDKKLHPTAAGMLMFGDEYNRLIRDIKVPFKTEGGNRIDDTPVHEALREALANCLINTDFYGVRGVVILKEQNRIVFENPGYSRTGKQQMRKGGVSDPRNKMLMKMFNLINIGERAGSGVPNIFNIWEDQGWMEPVIEEQFDPDRTLLILTFDKKQAKKTSDKKQAKKTVENMKKIRLYLSENGECKTSDIAEYIDLSLPRTRAILKEMDDIEAIGANMNRKYRLADENKM